MWKSVAEMRKMKKRVKPFAFNSINKNNTDVKCIISPLQICLVKNKDMFEAVYENMQNLDNLHESCYIYIHAGRLGNFEAFKLMLRNDQNSLKEHAHVRSAVMLGLNALH